MIFRQIPLRLRSNVITFVSKLRATAVEQTWLLMKLKMLCFSNRRDLALSRTPICASEIPYSASSLLGIRGRPRRANLVRQLRRWGITPLVPTNSVVLKEMVRRNCPGITQSHRFHSMWKRFSVLGYLHVDLFRNYLKKLAKIFKRFKGSANKFKEESSLSLIVFFYILLLEAFF